MWEIIVDGGPFDVILSPSESFHRYYTSKCKWMRGESHLTYCAVAPVLNAWICEAPCRPAFRRIIMQVHDACVWSAAFAGLS